MSTLSVSVNVIESTKTITVSLPDRELASLKYDGDINLSPIINSLTLLIDADVLIEADFRTTTEDPKAGLTLQILQTVFDKFNDAQKSIIPDVLS